MSADVSDVDESRGPDPEDGSGGSPGPGGGAQPPGTTGNGTNPIDTSTAKVISDTFFASTSKIVVQLLKPIRGVILGNLLGTYLYGLMNIAVPYINIFLILSNIGFGTAAMKLVPGYLHKGRKDLARMIYRSSAVLTMTFGSLWCILLLVFSNRIAERFAHQPDAVTPIRIYALVIPFLALNVFYGALYLAVQRGKLRAVITFIYGFFTLILPIVAVLWRRNVNLIIGGLVTAEVIGVVLFVVLFHRRIINRWGPEIGPLVKGMKEVFGFGYLFFFASLGWNLINSVDRLMVKFYLPTDQYGVYFMATRVITALSLVASTAGVALIPSLTVARDSGDRTLFRKQIHGTTRIAFLALVPVVILLYVLSRDIISLLLPPGFLPAASLIQILVFVGLVDIICRTGYASLVAYGRGGTAAIAYILAAVWNIFWNWILIPRYGLAGAAIATLSAFVVLAFFLQIMMQWISHAHVPLTNLLYPILISLVFPLIGWLLRDAGSIVRLVAVFVPGTAAYLLIALATGIIRRKDLEESRLMLTPRATVLHVRLTLKIVGIMEAISKRFGR
jgi:O-antigen/teichoic acid export membrane protein